MERIHCGPVALLQKLVLSERGTRKRGAFLVKSVASAVVVCSLLLCGYWIARVPGRLAIDPTLYEGIGANLVAGNGFSFDLGPPYRPEITRTPFVPYLVAGVYAMTGRNPRAVLWVNAVLVALAVAIGYHVAVRVSGEPFAAAIGGAIAAATPFVSGAAAEIGTEAPAMLQLALSALLLARWPEHRRRRAAPRHVVVLGLLLASLVLNRVNFTPAVLIAAAYVGVSCLRGRIESRRAWLTAGLFALALGGPVLAWSARNAAVGLPFSTAPVGAAASRVYDLKRYEAAVFPDGQFREPPENRLYFQHWQRRYGPEELLELECRNRAWLDRFLAEKGAWVAAATPTRLLGLFSASSVYPFLTGDPRGRSGEASALRWASRGVWLLSFAGLLVLWHRPWARWLWLVPVGTLIPVHLLTVCSPRYPVVLLPLLAPYGGAAVLWTWRKARLRRRGSPRRA